MYIEPRTNIRLLQNVPLDESFDHTIYFANVNAQANYFMSKQKYNLANYSYQRVRRGWARVGINAENLYNCNYMMFQNTSFGSKWFYAFIKSVEYINNEVSEIEFELDPMQTWFFNYEREMCFVERNHTASDNIGEHIEPENVDIGEYVFNGNYNPVLRMNDYYVLIAIVDTMGQTVDGHFYDKIYGGATIYYYDSNDESGINAKLTQYVQKPDSVIAMYVVPKILINTPPSQALQPNVLGTVTSNIINTVTNIPAISTNDTLDGYSPKNNKMYTYPYNFYHVDASGNGELNIRYEFCEGLKPVFQIRGNVTQPIQVILQPCNYKNNWHSDPLLQYDPIMTESLTLTGFPMCSWNTDAFKAWLAQNSVPIGVTGLMALETAILASNPVVGTLATVGYLASTLSQGYKASIKADISKGNYDSSNVKVSFNQQQFYGGRVSVNRVYARMIDDYFTRYGYALKINAIPQINVRPHWTFVKTIGCTIKGSIPSDDMKKICSIYDKGITFWRNASEVGDYSLDNSPQP